MISCPVISASVELHFNHRNNMHIGAISLRTYEIIEIKLLKKQCYQIWQHVL